MKITLLINKSCHCVDVEEELQVLGFDYEKRDIEHEPEIVERFAIKHCPTLIVDDYRVIPIFENNVTQLRQLLAGGKYSSIYIQMIAR